MSRLNIHIIEESTQPVYTLCGHLCVVHRFCVAINYKEKVNGNEPNCQLTNTTKHKFDENAETEDKVWTFRKVNADRSLLVSTRHRLNLMGRGEYHLTTLKYSSTNFESSKDAICNILNTVVTMQVEMLKVIVDLDFMGNIKGPAETILLERVCIGIFSSFS